MSLSSLIAIGIKCLEISAVVPPVSDVSRRMRCGAGSCAELKRRARRRNSFLLSLLTIRFLFLAGKHQRRLFDPTCVSLRGPLPEKSVARLHTQTPCPPCLDWFSVRSSEGITAICRLLRNKGGSAPCSLQYFRGITWPDKHALAPLHTRSLFYLDLSTHPNCPLNFIADHGLLSPLSTLLHEWRLLPPHRFFRKLQSPERPVFCDHEYFLPRGGWSRSAALSVLSDKPLAFPWPENWCAARWFVHKPERSQFPLGDHRSQLCEGVMGTRNCQLGVRGCQSVGHEHGAHCQLVLSWWRGSRTHSHSLVFGPRELDYQHLFMWIINQDETPQLFLHHFLLI